MLSSRFISVIRALFQLSLLIFFWWLGSVLQKLLHLPLSAGVVGLFLVLIALMSGLFKLEWIKTGSDLLLSELVLFFIPCVVGLMNYKTLFMTEGWQLICAVLVGTICVMVFTAYTVHFCFKIESWVEQHKKTVSTHENKA